MNLTNEQLLAKLDAAFKGITDTSVAGGSILNSAQFDRYVRQLQIDTTILPEARLVVMTSEKQDIDKVGFGGRVLGPPAAEGQSLAEGDFSNPTFGTVQMIAAETQGIVSLTDKLLRRNIERSNFENTLVDMFGERAGVDIEELGVNGDTDSADTFLALTNGWLKLAERVVVELTNDDITDSFTTAAAETTQTLYHGTEGVPILPGTWTLDSTGLVAHDVDSGDGTGTIVEDNASGISGTIDYTSGVVTLAGLTAATAYDYDYDAESFDKTADTFPENAFELMLRVVPRAYFKRPAEYRFWTPWNIENDYRNILKGRGTVLGDSVQTALNPLAYKSVPLRVANNVPITRILLSHPDNMLYGVFHEVQLEREREAKKKRTDWILNTEVAYDYEERTAAVRAEI